jgi:hypothetical protein
MPWTVCVVVPASDTNVNVTSQDWPVTLVLYETPDPDVVLSHQHEALAASASMTQQLLVVEEV